MVRNSSRSSRRRPSYRARSRRRSSPHFEITKILRDALADPDPLALLTTASALAFTADPLAFAPNQPLYGPKPEDLPEPGFFNDLVNGMLDAAEPETDALLRVWAAMLDDDLVSRRIITTLRKRDPAMPDWVGRIDETRPVRASSQTSALRHEETIFVEVATPAGPFTVACAIIRSGSPFLEDVYPISAGIDSILKETLPTMDRYVEGQDLSLADAGARLRDALQMGDMIVPPSETETWPIQRPLFEWVLRQLPEGGTGIELHEWTSEEIDRLVDDFMESEWAAGFGPDEAGHAERLFDFQASYGSNDPLRWGGTFVDQVMLDLYPRKVLAPTSYMRKMPTVLRALVQYANERSGIDPEFTSNALASVDDGMDDYLDAIDASGSNDPGEDRFMDFMSMLLDGGTPDDFLRVLLEDRVGGPDALAHLDATPLPRDEGLMTAEIPDDVVPRVEQLAEKAAEAAEEFFGDPEMVTATLRILSRIAAADPAIFRRRFTDPPTVAALCWIAGNNNDRFSHGDFSVRALQEFLGVQSSPTQRANVLLDAITPPDQMFGFEVVLGDPELLTSQARTKIIEQRDRLPAPAAEAE